MVHVKSCPLGTRGYPSKEYVLNGKAYIYCRGWVDMHNDELLEECKNCADHVSKAQDEYQREDGEA